MEFVSGTSVNTSIANIPCNADCKASVSATAWDIPKSNAITYHDAVNQTIKSASIGRCSEIVFVHEAAPVAAS